MRRMLDQADEGNHWRGNALRVLGTLLIACLLPWLAACTATISCPDSPGASRAVYLLKHGRHPTLVIADPNGALTRYGYGDWRYYAQANTGFSSGARALLWPTPAALGRQTYPALTPPGAENLHSTVKTGISELHSFEVSGHAADALRRELDVLFRQGSRRRLLRNDPYDFEFVPHPRAYWLGHSSNGMVAGWLESLGCRVSGGGFIVRLVVR